MLFADTPHTELTLEEVAQELATDKDGVENFIAHGWLDVRKDAQGHVSVTKASLRGFKEYALRDGLQLFRLIPKEKRPKTTNEFKEVKKSIDAIKEKELPERIRQAAQAAYEKIKSKSK
jgi:hypothetical protein